MRTISIAILTGAALLAAGCGSRDEATTNTGNDLGSNLLLDQPMNDASAMESAANVTTPLVPMDNGTGDILGETSGGDTGGNTTVESNVTGM